MSTEAKTKAAAQGIALIEHRHAMQIIRAHTKLLGTGPGDPQKRESLEQIMAAAAKSLAAMDKAAT